MTADEAIERLECMRLFMSNEDKKNNSKFLSDDYLANKMAIEALKKQSMFNEILSELQQYRETGLTPQMVKDLIKSEKAAHKVSDGILWEAQTALYFRCFCLPDCTVL